MSDAPKNAMLPVMTDAKGQYIYPGDKIILKRGKWEGFIAVVKRIGLKDWKGSHNRIPRACAVVEVCGVEGSPRTDLPWAPFGILGDGVELVEKGENHDKHHETMMALVGKEKPVVKISENLAWLHVFRFNLKFYFGADSSEPGLRKYDTGVGGDNSEPELRKYDTDVGAFIAAVTSRGFEMWRGILPGRNLLQEIGEAHQVTATLFDRKGTTGRIVTLSISDPDYLPFGVGIELGGQRGGRLDAALDEVALEGVVFRNTKVIRVEDWEGGSDDGMRDDSRPWR